MAVTCANCGEELLGAVNRCWRCGQHVLSAPGSGEAPPVRQLPPPLHAAVPVATIVIEESGAVVESETESPVQIAAVVGPAVPVVAIPAADSPPPRAANYSQRGVVDVAAIASMVFGAMALLLGVFFSWAIVFGFLGIAAGLWGFRSRWRQIAVIGLLVSLMGVFGSSARLAYDAFGWWTGQSLLGPPTSPDDATLPDSLE